PYTTLFRSCYLPLRAAQYDSTAYADRVYAPADNRATWFALMALLMNLALVAGQLQTKLSQSGFRRPAWRLLGVRSAVDYCCRAWFRLPNWCDPLIRQACMIKPDAAEG